MKPFLPDYDKIIVDHVEKNKFLLTLNTVLNESGLDIKTYPVIFDKMFTGGISKGSISISRSLLQGNMIINKISPNDKSKILQAFDHTINLLFSGKKLKRRVCRIL
jgi:hypothetical protein